MPSFAQALWIKFQEEVKRQLSIDEKQYKKLNDLMLDCFTTGISEDDTVIEVWKALGKV